MMHQQSMMVGDMISVHSEIPTHVEEMNNISYENNASYAYDDLFPALPHSQPPVQRSIQQATNKLRVGSSLHTQVFHVPYEERKLDNANTFGEGESLRTCQSITKDTGAHIEISTSKDGSLTFLMTGKLSAVLDARRLILTHFQQQASKQISIPKEHHRWILGKQGQKLKELEKVTATKISVPGIAENSETLTITGTKEGIEKAEHEIRVCSEEQSRKALERVKIPKIYHPFIQGPYGERAAALTAETGARIHIPPASTQSDEIVIAGEKNGVIAAKAQIEQIYQDMVKKCSTVRVEVPKSQHKYVIGARGTTIQEILKETEVSVEMPPPDSPTGTITLHGPHNKIGLALSKVCEKANSVKTATVDAPTWIHKYIIGKNGSNIKKITQEFSKVHVDITHSEDKVKIDGPPEEVERAQLELDSFVKNLLATLTYVELSVDPKFFKHIIGKSGTNINRLKDETGVVINIIENEGNNIIRIEGSRQGVTDAERELREMVLKLENERTKEVYVDHRYIKSLIGVRGEKIKELREKFERVLITLPDQGQKRSPVKLRGPQEDIEKCEKYLHKVIKEIAEWSYVQEVPIFKQFHKFIIGKGGANLRKIRDETQTVIDLPAEGDDSDVITVRGKRENVEEAVKKIQQIHNEKANVVTEEVTIAPKYYNSLIGAGGKLIHSIMEECGGVLIKFPPAESDSDKVVIKGPIEDVEKAKQQLLAHASERELTSHTAHVRAKPEHHKFLIGKNGTNIKKIREQTGARIIFPTDKDEDKEAIFIIGREEQVEAARKQLEAAVAEISNVSEGEMAVAPRHHRHFVARRGEVLRRIADDCGGVQISFPRQGVNSDRVVLKGPKECIEAAKIRINEIIEDLEAKTQPGANLLNHLKHVHKDLHKEVMDQSQSTISDAILKECTNLVAVHGRPFSMLHDKAFQNLLSLIPGNAVTINASNVKENVHLLATKMREEIACTLQDKIISLKIDIASLATRSFMGINCQYLQEGQLVLRNLGVIEIFQRHTSEHLKDLLVYNLQRFRINTGFNKNIYSVTTDNGANVIKMSKLLNDIDSFDSLDLPVCIEPSTSVNQSHNETNLADTSNNYHSVFDNSEFNNEFEEMYTAILTNVLRAQFITGEHVEYKVDIVRCAAHTLQLALHDACDVAAFRNHMSSCREIVRRLQTPQFVKIIRENGKNVPKLDCATRWHSVVDMVESLLSLKDVCATDVRLHLPDTTWDSLAEVLKSLMPAKEFTKKLQEEELTVGDFYLSWMKCQFKLAKITTRLSDNIVSSMKARQKILFENDIFINGIFLDPRVNTVLTLAQQKKAKENLIMLYIKYVELEQKKEENNIENSNIDNTAPDVRSEAQMELDDFLNTSYINKHADLINLLQFDEKHRNLLVTLQDSIEVFLKEPLLQSSESVLAYWEKSRYKFPFLYKLSTIVLGVPMTQVSVERLFSSLKFVVSNYTYSMKENVIEDILFIRSNNIFNK